RLDRRWRTAAVLASLASGALLTRLGRRRTLVAFGLVTMVPLMALFPLAQGQSGTLAGLAAVALLNIAYASAGTAVYTINMDWSRPGSAGSGFTGQDSLVHLCQLLARAAAPPLPRPGSSSHPRPRWCRSKHPSARWEPRSHLTVVSCVHGFFRPAPTD